MSTVQSAVELHDAVKRYPSGTSERVVLGPVSLSVPKGRFVAVMGPSGSGKSTLLHLMGALSSPSSGQVEIDGKPIGGLTDDELAKLRGRAVGFVFQSFNLVPVLSVRENVALPAVIAGDDHDDVVRRVDALLDLVGLADLADQRPGTLSGGEQQRAAVARALITTPAVLLADEPTGNLDGASGDQVLQLLARLPRELGQTLVVVTHDPHVAAAADEVVLLRDGVIVDRLDFDTAPRSGPAGSEQRRRAVLGWLQPTTTPRRVKAATR